MFVDKVKLIIKAGNGGNGAISFHREKFVDKGGPAGGDGGRGGSIYFVADSGITTLLDFKFRRIIESGSGENGGKNNMFGKSAEDIIVKVPVGTIVINEQTQQIVADFKTPGQKELIAKGGRGGRGNAKFVTPVNQVPRVAENGEEGETYNAVIELKLLADVGLVGLPSVGKSTIVSVVSSAKPQIASYHFTTLSPVLGLVRVKNTDDSFVMADLPGLIEGASEGKGLGFQFLKHVERCKVLIHVLDMGSEEGRDPLEDFELINNELKSYKIGLLEKPMIIAANKMDIEDANNNLERFKQKYPTLDVFPISSLTKQGLDALIYKANELVKKEKEKSIIEVKEDKVIYNLKEKNDGFIITHPEDHVFVISGDRVERLYHMTNISEDQGIMYLLSTLRKMGVDDKLEQMGIKDGDIVRLCDYEFEYYE